VNKFSVERYFKKYLLFDVIERRRRKRKKKK
jgi:hypothetical protein